MRHECHHIAASNVRSDILLEAGNDHVLANSELLSQVLDARSFRPIADQKHFRRRFLGAQLGERVQQVTVCLLRTQS